MAGSGSSQPVTIRRVGPADLRLVLEAAALFDAEPREDWTAGFVAREGHHFLIAYVGERPAGFVTGIEIIHPDKGNEMMLYELGVDPAYRRQGIGRGLVGTLRDLAVARGCRGMWVPLARDDTAAMATYRSAGADTYEATAIMSWDFPPP